MIAAWGLAALLAAEPAAGPREPEDRTESDVPREPDPPDPDPPAPEPEPEPEPEPQPEPEPEPQPEPEPDPEDEDEDAPRRVTGAPNVDVDVAGGGAQLDLGGDVVIRSRCNDKRGCNGGRIGLKLRLPVSQRSPTGGDRATVDALDGFSSSWRLGLIGDYIRDATKEDGPALLYMLTAGVDFGIQTFRHFPGGGDGAQTDTRSSIAGLLRFLAYVHEPRRYRVAPQILVTYARNWAGAPAVGVEIPDGEPAVFTEPKVITPPGARPVFTASLPVLFSIQRGKYVLPQLGFGPTARWAAAGSVDGYNPFDGGHTLRGEFWLYWYPLGTEGLELQKTNVRIGVSPFVDAFVVGRAPGEPVTNVGALVEIKLGVRGYEY